MNSFQSIDNAKKPSQLYTTHVLDSTGEFTTKAIAPLESFLTLTSHYPVKVQTKMKGIVVRNPAILLLAMLTTNPADQKEILQVNRNLARKILDDSKGRRVNWDFESIAIVEWIFRLVIAQHYKTISPILKEIMQTENMHVVYMGENRSDRYGVVHQKGIFTGTNYYGEVITRLIETFSKDPESLLTVPLPDVPDEFNLLGMPVGEYRRSLSVSDEKAAPKPSQVFKLGISKSEKFLSE